MEAHLPREFYAPHDKELYEVTELEDLVGFAFGFFFEHVFVMAPVPVAFGAGSVGTVFFICLVVVFLFVDGIGLQSASLI